MTKFNALLLMAVIASALLLVKTAYDARRLFSGLHRAKAEAAQLDGEHKRLEAERELQATNQRVDQTARTRLRMATATPAITMYEGRTAISPASAASTTLKTNPTGARP